jgi:hypothetical protein
MDTTEKSMASAERLLRRSEAAKYVVDTYNVPCSPKTLAKLACISSEGPPFRLAGRFPLYPTSGLDKWAQSKIGPLVRSTSEVRRVAIADLIAGFAGLGAESEESMVGTDKPDGGNS